MVQKRDDLVRFSTAVRNSKILGKSGAAPAAAAVALRCAYDEKVLFYAAKIINGSFFFFFYFFFFLLLLLLLLLDGSEPLFREA